MFVAELIFTQMGDEAHPVPAWTVVGAGTGGTSATVGRLQLGLGAIADANAVERALDEAERLI